MGLTMGYSSSMPFSRDDLDHIDRAKEIEIETSAGPGDEVHRTIIWAVVDGDDVFIRSWRGVTARWYREALANPAVAINLGKRRLAARAVPAHDVESDRGRPPSSSASTTAIRPRDRWSATRS